METSRLIELKSTTAGATASLYRASGLKRSLRCPSPFGPSAEVSEHRDAQVLMIVTRRGS